MEAQGFGGLEPLDEFLGPDTQALTGTCTSRVGQPTPFLAEQLVL